MKVEVVRESETSREELRTFSFEDTVMTVRA